MFQHIRRRFFDDYLCNTLGIQLEFHQKNKSDGSCLLKRNEVVMKKKTEHKGRKRKNSLRGNAKENDSFETNEELNINKRKGVERIVDDICQKYHDSSITDRG